MIFDGKAFARGIENQVAVKVSKMVNKPRIVSVLIGNNPASVLYTKLKKKSAERVGIEFEVRHDIENLEIIAKREDVTGVMVQLPLPGHTPQETEEVIKAIPLEKDVDGLRWEESGIKPATVRAVLAILERIAELRITNYELWKTKFVVVGARGAVGRPLVHFLRERGVEVTEIEWDTPEEEVKSLCRRGEVVVSCVGKEGMVTGGMVRKGVIAIDVGSPKGDMTRDVYEKVSVSVEVPGGVGPVTIACLLENAVELV